MLSFFNVWYYFARNPGFFKSLFDNVLDLIGQHSLYAISIKMIGIISSTPDELSSGVELHELGIP